MLANDHISGQWVLALSCNYVLVVATGIDTSAYGRRVDTLDGLLVVGGHLRADCALAAHTLPTDDLHVDMLAAQLLAFLHFIMVVAQSDFLHPEII